MKVCSCACRSDIAMGLGYQNVIDISAILTGRALPKKTSSTWPGPIITSQFSFAKILKLRESFILTMSDCWSSIAASVTPIIFRPGPALPQLGRGCIMMSSCEERSHW